MAQRVKDLALLLLRLRLLPWHRLDLWPGNFHMLWVLPKKKKKKTRKKKKKEKEINKRKSNRKINVMRTIETMREIRIPDYYKSMKSVFFLFLSPINDTVI